MPDRPPPIRVPCEGSGQTVTRTHGAFTDFGLVCPACGGRVDAHQVGDEIVAHDRTDVAAMVTRGHFDD